MTPCTRCQTTGFLNIEQVPEDVRAADDMIPAVLEWMEEMRAKREELGGCRCSSCAPCSYCMASHDVQVCDCCGNGEDWYGDPGYHYGLDDPKGDRGPYRYNGGLCECH